MTTHIAQVGAYKRRTSGDLGRWLTSIAWMLDNRHPFDGAQHDVVNLRYGRDFLTELLQYDIVVLHDIFDPVFTKPGQVVDVSSGFPAGMRRSIQRAIATSPHHSIETWRARLVTTQARLIFVYETSTCCVNGWQLNDLPGYVIRSRDTQRTIYERRTPDAGGPLHTEP